MGKVAAEDAVAAFERLGFTQYEAKVFVGLSAIGRSSVSDLYAVAEVPRSAVYGVLESLVDRGFVEVSRGKPSIYQALPAEKVIAAIGREFDASRKEAMRRMESVKAATEPAHGTPEMIWFVRGQSNIEAKVAALLRGARAYAFVGMKGNHIERFSSQLGKAAKRGVRILYLTTPGNRGEYECLRKFAEPVNIPQPEGFTKQPNMGFVYVDGSAALVISFSDDETGEMDSAFYTQSEAFLSFIQIAISSIIGPLVARPKKG